MFHLVRIDTLPSTNDYLKENHGNLSDFTIVRADYQTAGRGQFRRTWESLPNQNLLCSLLIKTALSGPTVLLYEKCVLTSLIELLSHYGIQGQIKAPNDVYVGAYKIAGILIETKQTDGHYDYLVIGIGLNVRQTAFSEGLQATSLVLETKKDIAVDDVFAHLLVSLENGIRALR